MENTKACCKCKIVQPINNFGKLKSTKDGLRYDCKDCRREFRLNNKEHIQSKHKEYYAANKESLDQKARIRWNDNKDRYNKLRYEYRKREDVQKHNREYYQRYTKHRLQTDISARLRTVVKSRLNSEKIKHNRQYDKYVGCSMSFLKSWLEYRFDKNMNWDNIGSYWEVDHILPVCKFDLSSERDKLICFHWTNLQPLPALENRSKGGKLLLHYYYNNIVSVNRFNEKYKQFLGYQNIRNSLCWLREKLRCGNNPQIKQDNPQPIHQKITIKMKRFND